MFSLNQFKEGNNFSSSADIQTLLEAAVEDPVGQSVVVKAPKLGGYGPLSSRHKRPQQPKRVLLKSSPTY